ncbi:MAG: hypoxanthine phosphoribosyltransferase [Candidatus Poribacteria bacterium]|nr:hypoxanthine phosphoribosyltransferase [Candidatus Poribacteria bacterium]
MSATKPLPESVLISESRLQSRIQELGAQIFTDYENQELVLLGVLRGSVLFFADLARAIFRAQLADQGREVALRFEFVQLVSYHNSTKPSAVQLIRGGSDYLKQRHILIVEDIIDTGRTLEFLHEHLKPLNPKTVKVCTLLDKPVQRQVSVAVDYIGFEIPDAFVVGYGLDYAQQYRNLPYIAVLEST